MTRFETLLQWTGGKELLIIYEDRSFYDLTKGGRKSYRAIV